MALPLTHSRPVTLDAGSGEQLGETIRQLHHGGVPREQLGEPVWMQSGDGRHWHVARGSAEHTRLVGEGAVELAAEPSTTTRVVRAPAHNPREVNDA